VKPGAAHRGSDDRLDSAVIGTESAVRFPRNQNAADRKPEPKAQVVARLAIAPVSIGAAAISSEAITVEADEDGEVVMKLVTGATVHVTIQAVNWTKQFVVPPPPAAGMPVRLFSL
jgi:hypothetical protein